MRNRAALTILAAIFVAVVTCSATAQAGPASGKICRSADDGGSLLVLARLVNGENDSPSADMSLPQGLVPANPPEAPAALMLAGQCGSSDYYCESPGFTYCCGNSTDGYYCAPDVNGCTR